MKTTVKGMLVGFLEVAIVVAMLPYAALAQQYDPSRNGQLNGQGEMWNGFEYVKLPHNAYHAKGLVFHEEHGGQFWGWNGKDWVLLPVRIPGGTTTDDVSHVVSRLDQPTTVRDKDGCLWSFDGKKWTCDGKRPTGLLSPSPSSERARRAMLEMRRKMQLTVSARQIIGDCGRAFMLKKKLDLADLGMSKTAEKMDRWILLNGQPPRSGQSNGNPNASFQVPTAGSVARSAWTRQTSPSGRAPAPFIKTRR